MKVLLPVLLVIGVCLVSIGTHESPFWLRTICWFTGVALLMLYQAKMEEAIEKSKVP